MIDPVSHDDFTFWFALKSVAMQGEWPQVMAMLDEQPARAVVRHALTIPVLVAAVTAGQADVVAALLARGVVPARDDLVSVLDVMAFDSGEQVAAQVQALRVMTGAMTAGMLRVVAEENWVRDNASVELARLAQAGVDILLGGRAVDIVLAQDEPALMTVVLAAGVSPFSPRMVREMSVRPPQDVLRQAWQKTIDGHADTQAAVDVFARLCREAPAWRAAMFLNPVGYDGTGAAVTLLGVLAGLGRAGEVFDAARWHTNRQEAFAVHAALSDYGLRHKISLAAFAAEMNRATMRARDARRKGPDFRI